MENGIYAKFNTVKGSILALSLELISLLKIF